MAASEKEAAAESKRKAAAESKRKAAAESKRKAREADAAAEAKKSDDERVLLIEEEGLPPSKPKRSALNHLTQLVQGLFSNNHNRSTPDNAKSDKSRAKQSMLRLRMKIQEEVIPEVESNFAKYNQIWSECKRLGLGANGKRDELQKKLVKKMTDDRFNKEVMMLKEQMKKYVPDSDPEAEDLHDIFQSNRYFENNLWELGSDY